MPFLRVRQRVPDNPTSGGPGCPDGGDSGVTCPDSYTLFAAGKAEEAWLADVLDPVTGLPRQLKARTWVVGISQDVGPCELNYTAYRGRTDASDPSGLAGIDSASGLDPYLPEGSPGTYDGPIEANCGSFHARPRAHPGRRRQLRVLRRVGDAALRRHQQGAELLRRRRLHHLGALDLQHRDRHDRDEHRLHHDCRVPKVARPRVRLQPERTRSSARATRSARRTPPSQGPATC